MSENAQRIAALAAEVATITDRAVSALERTLRLIPKLDSTDTAPWRVSERYAWFELFWWFAGLLDLALWEFGYREAVRQDILSILEQLSLNRVFDCPDIEIIRKHRDAMEARRIEYSKALNSLEHFADSSSVREAHFSLWQNLNWTVDIEESAEFAFSGNRPLLVRNGAQDVILATFGPSCIRPLSSGFLSFLGVVLASRDFTMIPKAEFRDRIANGKSETMSVIEDDGGVTQQDVDAFLRQLGDLIEGSDVQ